jgi:ABC-type sugar transport system ATPase subunit
MSNGVILELKELDVFYGPIQALKKVSLHINEGETVSLIGCRCWERPAIPVSLPVSAHW